MIVAFEILSPSTRDRDLRWKRSAYLPSLMHYVVVAQDAVEVVVFDRDTASPPRVVNGPEASLDLPKLGVTLPLEEVFRDTGLGRQ
jgi:Uma2 family endonuclease